MRYACYCHWCCYRRLESWINDSTWDEAELINKPAHYEEMMGTDNSCQPAV